MAESNRYAFPFHNKIEQEAEEVPLQEIVYKNIQNFTREDFEQAKKDLENNKDGEVKGFTYTYFEQMKTEEAPQPQTETTNVEKSQKEEEKPAFLSVNFDLPNEPTATPTYSPSTEERNSLPAYNAIEQKADAVRRLPKQLKPIGHKKPPAREDDLCDENASFLNRCYMR